MRAVIMTIGYRKYLVYAVHLTNLMVIAAECPAVKMVPGHYDKFEIDPEGEGFIEDVALHTIRVDDGSSAAEPAQEPVTPIPARLHPLAKPIDDDDIAF